MVLLIDTFDINCVEPSTREQGHEDCSTGTKLRRNRENYSGCQNGSTETSRRSVSGKQKSS